MPRHGDLNFRQRDVTAAVKAVKNAGESVARIEVAKDGSFTLYVGSHNIVADEELDPWRARLNKAIRFKGRQRP